MSLSVEPKVLLSLITVTLSLLFIGFPLPFLDLAKTFVWRSISVQYNTAIQTGQETIYEPSQWQPHPFLGLIQLSGTTGWDESLTHVWPRVFPCTHPCWTQHALPPPRMARTSLKSFPWVVAHPFTSRAAQPPLSSCISCPVPGLVTKSMQAHHTNQLLPSRVNSSEQPARHHLLCRTCS